MVVNHALKSRNVKLVEMGISIGVPGKTKYKKEIFDESLTKTRRIYPHLEEFFDGFFIAKFKKLGDGD